MLNRRISANEMERAIASEIKEHFWCTLALGSIKKFVANVIAIFS